MAVEHNRSAQSKQILHTLAKIIEEEREVSSVDYTISTAPVGTLVITLHIKPEAREMFSNMLPTTTVLRDAMNDQYGRFRLSGRPTLAVELDTVFHRDRLFCHAGNRSHWMTR